MSLSPSSNEGFPKDQSLTYPSPASKAQDVSPRVLEPDRISAYLTEIKLQIPKVRQGLLQPRQIQSVVDEALAVGLPKEELSKLLSEYGVSVVERSHLITEEQVQELAGAAYRKSKEIDQEEQELLLNHDMDVETNLQIERSNLPDEIGMRFQAHGIAKGTAAAQLRSLIGLLDNKFDQGKILYTTNLRRSDENEIAGAVGAAGPYDTGGFIILGEPRKLHQPISETKDISETGVKGVLVNREWYDAIPTLQSAYPNIKFIRADQMQTLLSEWLRQIDNP